MTYRPIQWPPAPGTVPVPGKSAAEMPDRDIAGAVQGGTASENES